jgi:hypothetical protein
VNWDDHADECAATEAASRIFLDRIKSEFDADFEEVNIGPGADMPAFVTVIASHVIPLIRIWRLCPIEICGFGPAADRRFFF